MALLKAFLMAFSDSATNAVAEGAKDSAVQDVMDVPQVQLSWYCGSFCRV